jgi:tetratricopeptide (TPR) repeat protein
LSFQNACNIMSTSRTIKTTILVALLLGSLSFTYSQRSRVMAVYTMIDQGKYEEAKEDIELAAWNDRTARWPRTYYAKGLLCQTAYEEGIKLGDSKRTTLYPDQLYVAYTAYERALALDVSGRLKTLISQRYYYLYNDFEKLGTQHFQKKEYDKALSAFEQALIINNSDLVEADIDTSMVYNAALAAYESSNWEKAVAFLAGLHEAGYDPSVGILLYRAHMKLGDTASAEQVLVDGLELYHYDTQVLIYLVTTYMDSGRIGEAIQVLDRAIAQRPGEYLFPWSRGMIHERNREYDLAIEDFNKALSLSPDNPKICYHMGLIYYNQGVELREQSLTISDNMQYRRIKTRVAEEFREAVKWFEKSYELDPDDEETVSRMQQLYYQLQMTDKAGSLRFP